MQLRGERMRNLKTPQQTVDAEYFRGRKVHAVAGIGNPQRFFDHLRSLGLAFEPHAFADHHAFTAQDLTFDDGDEIIMTAKDAVKCLGFAGPHCWQLPVDAVLDGDLAGQILHQIGKPR
jgi:tetraacyldisaccharide 4'-kinase